MVVLVSISTLDGEMLGPMTFPGPVKVAELRKCVQETQNREVVKLLLGDRVLSDAEELADPELMITAVAMKYEAMAIDRFEELDLHADLLRGIYSYGFEQPSPFQKCAIRPLIDGRNLIAEACSGTGKTATYLVGGLQRIDLTVAFTQMVVLAPTRELACPIQKAALSIGTYMHARCHACVGGMAMTESVDELRKAPHLVVGTPGRVQQMVSKRHLSLDALKLFVLDEMDELVSRGFKGLIYDTMEILPPDVQLAVFSATMPTAALDEMKRFLNNPVRLLMKKDNLTLDGVRQFYVACESESNKADVLIELLELFNSTQLVIYCNTRRKVAFLANALGTQNITVSTVHADLEQKERDLIMSKFVPGSPGVLITTDLLGGIDVQAFPVVFNYDLPHNVENYLHRAGRSGHFYGRGVVINLVTNNDVRTLRDIERFYHTQVEEMPVDILDLV